MACMVLGIRWRARCGTTTDPGHKQRLSSGVETPAQATRGGGASGAARTQEKTVSPGRIASTSGAVETTATTTGGGGAPPTDSHCDTMPPQASIAFKTSVCDDTVSTTGEAVSSVETISLQQAGLLGEEQQLACFFAEQHDDAATVFSAGAATRR